MSRVAAQHGSVNLGQGFPDFDPPREVMDAAKKAIDDGFNQYAVTWGAPPLREAICRKLGEFNRIEARPDDNIVVTCGDRKSTRLNSSHSQISYAVFCLKKK